jgi:GDP-L-fucose synthase
VLPALIRKVHEAKEAGRDEVVLWGSGRPRREFLYADDLGSALVFLAGLDDARFATLTDPAHCPLINVGTGEDLEVRELAALIAEAIGWRGRFVHDTSKPDGTMRKVMDVSRLRALGWAPAIDLRAGIADAYADFLARYG